MNEKACIIARKLSLTNAGKLALSLRSVLFVMLYIHNSRNRVKCYVNIINLLCRWIHHGILPNIHKSRGEETSALVSNNHSFIRIENIITPPSVDVDIAIISRAAMGLWKGSFRLI